MTLDSHYMSNHFVSPEQIEFYSKKRTDFKTGQIVFYIKGRYPHYTISVGVIGTMCSHCGLYVFPLYFRYYKTINGILKEDFKTPSPWVRIPKEYFKEDNYELFHEESSLPKELSKYNVDLKDIKEAYKLGLLVKAEEIDQSHFEVEFDNSRAFFRIVRRYSDKDRLINTLSLSSAECFSTYEDAEEMINIIKNEYVRKANLSDYELSVEDIDYHLDLWSSTYNISEFDKEAVRKFLLSKENVEDIETSFFGDKIRWRYADQLTWKVIILSDFFDIDSEVSAKHHKIEEKRIN